MSDSDDAVCEAMDVCVELDKEDLKHLGEWAIEQAKLLEFREKEKERNADWKKAINDLTARVTRLEDHTDIPRM
jgi:hypothetical protein